MYYNYKPNTILVAFSPAIPTQLLQFIAAPGISNKTKHILNVYREQAEQ